MRRAHAPPTHGPPGPPAPQPPAVLVEQCGKLALLERLLDRLKAGGHKVLIFSQACAAGAACVAVVVHVCARLCAGAACGRVRLWLWPWPWPWPWPWSGAWAQGGGGGVAWPAAAGRGPRRAAPPFLR